MIGITMEIVFRLSSALNAIAIVAYFSTWHAIGLIPIILGGTRNIFLTM